MVDAANVNGVWVVAAAAAAAKEEVEANAEEGREVGVLSQERFFLRLNTEDICDDLAALAPAKLECPPAANSNEARLVVGNAAAVATTSRASLMVPQAAAAWPGEAPRHAMSTPSSPPELELELRWERRWLCGFRLKASTK